MDRVAVQDPVSMGRVTAEAVQAQGSKEVKVVMATKVVTISRITREVNSSNSRVIRATQIS